MFCQVLLSQDCIIKEFALFLVSGYIDGISEIMLANIGKVIVVEKSTGWLHLNHILICINLIFIRTMKAFVNFVDHSPLRRFWHSNFSFRLNRIQTTLIVQKRHWNSAMLLSKVSWVYKWGCRNVLRSGLRRLLIILEVFSATNSLHAFKMNSILRKYILVRILLMLIIKFRIIRWSNWHLFKRFQTFSLIFNLAFSLLAFMNR